MPDRRRFPRFVLTEAIVAHARVLDDVDVERLTEDEILVLAAAPAFRGENLLVQTSSAAGGIESLEVEAIDSQPVLDGNRVRHRLTLRVLRGTHVLSLWAQET